MSHYPFYRSCCGDGTSRTTEPRGATLSYLDLASYCLTRTIERIDLDHRTRLAGIEHRLTKPNHPWTNGKVERMNLTLKEATVRRYYYDSHDQLRQHLAAFLDAYNFATRLKTLKGLTPFESICKAWTNKPDRFKHEPIQLTSGLHS